MTVRVGFKRLSTEAIVPTKAHASDSGFDLYAAEDVIIEPGETKIIPTGISIELPEGFEAQVRPRSGITAKTKLRVQLGTIDQDYRGEIGVIVDNINAEYVARQSGYMTSKSEYDFSEKGKVFPKAFTYKIRKGERIAQLVVQYLPQLEAIEIDDLDVTQRGDRGFGSSGV